MLIVPFFLILAYLLGSISTAILICRLLGLPDPRETGSKNPGATNVLRLGGKKVAAFVLIGDLLKGLIAVGLANFFSIHGYVLGLVALSAVIGHVFPLFYQFKGGKGVATAIGGLIGISLLLGALCILTWLAVAKLYHYSSAAALASITAAPFFTLFIIPGCFLPLAAMAGLLWWTHRENLQRLQAGTESKIRKG